MSISLKQSIKLPDEWDVTPNGFGYIEECYNEAKELNLIGGGKKEYYQISNGAMVASYFWCKSVDMRLAGHFIIFFLLFDDYLDNNKLEFEKASQIVSRNEYILLEGKLPPTNDPSYTPNSLERHSLFVRNLALEYSNGRVDVFCAFISYFIEWCTSVIPLAKLSECKSIQLSHIQKYIRNVNIGINICQGITLILFKDKVADVSLLLNPRYQKLVSITSEITSQINDIVSYSKEVNYGCGNTNMLSILQKSDINPLSIDEAFTTMCNNIHQLINEFQYQESKLLESIPSQLTVIIDHLKHYIKGTFEFSLLSKRYITSNSPFIELLDSSNDNHIIKEHLKQ